MTDRRDDLTAALRRCLRAGRGLAAGLLVAGGLAAPAAAPDPRLGAPFAERERAALGSATAPMVVLEISSFNCTHCRIFHEQVFPALRTAYIETGKVRWVVLNASDDPGEQYSPAYLLARCALRQGRYWEVLGTLFQLAPRPANFQAGLLEKNPLIDRDALALCRQDRTVRAAVTLDFADYVRAKARGTPTFLVRMTARDGARTETTIAGAQPLEYFRRVFDEMLKAP